MSRHTFAFLIAGLSLFSVLSFAAPALEAGGGGGGGGGCMPSDSVTSEIEITHGCYSPIIAYVEPGATVRWTNHDPLPHNVALLGQQTPLGGVQLVQGGETLDYVFAEPGLFAYYCTLHPGMFGVVAAGDPASEEFAATLRERSPAQMEAAITSGPPDAEGPAVAGSAEADGGVSTALAAAIAAAVGIVSAGGSAWISRRSVRA